MGFLTYLYMGNTFIYFISTYLFIIYIIYIYKYTQKIYVLAGALQTPKNCNFRQSTVAGHVKWIKAHIAGLLNTIIK